MFRKLPSIPYMGSKREIAFDIVNFIRMKNPKAKVFIDMFGGGGAITVQALYQGFDKVIYNELNPRVFNLLSFLRNLNGKGLPKEWYRYISRDEFKKIINSDDTSAFAGMVECCWSFGNRGKTYIYGKEIENKKRLLEDLVINQSRKAQQELKKIYNIDFNIPQQKTIYERYSKGLKPQIRKRIDLQQLEQLQRLQRLERLEQLQRLQRLERLERLQRLQRLQRLEIKNLSYIDVIKNIDLSKYNTDEVVIYCDPPYRETEKYTIGGFNHKEFDDWFLNIPYKGYLSEYKSPFEKVYSVMKRSLLSSTNKSSKKEECLFINKLNNVKEEKKEIEKTEIKQLDLL